MKNIDIVNRTVADKFNIDEDIVKNINKVYWQEVRHKLSNLDSTSVFVKGLLTFTVSRYNLSVYISKIIRQIRGTRNSVKFKAATKELFLTELYRKLNLLLIQRNEVAKIYYERNKRLYKSNT